MNKRHPEVLSELLGDGYEVSISPVVGGGMVVKGPDCDSFTSGIKDKMYVCWLIDDRLTRKALLVNTVFGPKGTVYSLMSAIKLGHHRIKPVLGEDQLDIRLEALLRMKEPLKLEENRE